MIRKFATVSGSRGILAIILMSTLGGATTLFAQQAPAPAQQAPPQQPSAPQDGAAAPAQQTPAQQTPAGDQSSGSQEASPEELGPRHKVKPKEYTDWTYHVGLGASLTSGTTEKFVRSGGPVAAVGVARNYSKYFGFQADFEFDNLPLRDSAMLLAQAPGATSHVYSFALDPIIYVPVNSDWSAYIVMGPGFFHRSGKLNSSTAVAGTACNAFWQWWGTCFNGSIPLNNRFLNTSQNELAANFGGGLARRITPKIEIYAEFRYLHGSGGGRTTDLRPITVGMRW